MLLCMGIAIIMISNNPNIKTKFESDHNVIVYNSYLQ